MGGGMDESMDAGMSGRFVDKMGKTVRLRRDW